PIRSRDSAKFCDPRLRSGCVAQNRVEHLRNTLFDAEHGQGLGLHLRTNRSQKVGSSKTWIEIRSTAFHLGAITADSRSRMQSLANALLHPHFGRPSRWRSSRFEVGGY